MTVASPRPRPARQGLTDFTLPIRREDLDDLRAATGEPDWLDADRAGGVRRVRGAAGRIQHAVHDLYRPAHRQPRRGADPPGRRRSRPSRSRSPMGPTDCWC